MVSCPVCATDNPPGSRFCNGCGARLAADLVVPPAPPAGLGQERKVISVLFCDLVGFTAASDGADPEDIDAMLDGYFSMARAAIERHGGVVEKFIGDAVVGLFGVPIAHEDDPERAVRAALEILRDAADVAGLHGQPLRLRVGVNTGEALVHQHADAASGQHVVTGDPINTASRIQSAAPELGVAVGQLTYEATRRAIDYEPLAAVTVKGKADPLTLHRAVGARAGGRASRGAGRLVGRDWQLARLVRLFEDAAGSRRLEVALVTGEPGIGKTRLTEELRHHLGRTDPAATWLQGRSLPYGEGITFWALGEIVKAHAGILESDTGQTAAAKLEATLPPSVDRAWLRERLLPLIGIEPASRADQGELFTAWSRYLELVCASGPAVVLFEDLHWADPGLLAFLDDVATRVVPGPLLVLGTARPELLDRLAAEAPALEQVPRVELPPLADDATTQLLGEVLGAGPVSAPLQRTIATAAGGNPLFTEELARFLHDRDLLVDRGVGWELSEGSAARIPSSVHALIAARLDALPAGAKALLSDAAVVGEVFWQGAVEAMSHVLAMDASETLALLSRRDFVRAAGPSSLEGEAEFAFRHVLVRDVAYNQLPRPARADRHVAAARWIERRAAGRVEDVADVLAAHYATALELNRAVGRGETADAIVPDAIRYLTLAGERAQALDTRAALAHFERALALTPQNDPDRAAALGRFGKVATRAGRYEDAVGALDEAVALSRATGDLQAGALATVDLVLPLGRLGDSRAWGLPSVALRMLDGLPPSADHVVILTEVAVDATVLGRYDEGIETAERAIELAKQLDMPTPFRALAFLGLAKAQNGDASGLEDQRRALELAIAAGEGSQVPSIANNLGVSLWMFEGPAAAARVIRDGARFAEARGLADMAVSLRCGELDALVDLGDLEGVVLAVEALVPDLEAGKAVFNLATVRIAQARVLEIRGDAIEAAAWIGELEGEIRTIGSPDFVAALGVAATIRRSLGQPDVARALLEELDAAEAVETSPNFFHYLPAVARAAVDVGAVTLVGRLLARSGPVVPSDAATRAAAGAILAEAIGDIARAEAAYEDAATRCEALGLVPEYAFAALGRGRCLIALGRPSEARPPLEAAHDLFARLGAVRANEESVRLLREAG